MTTDPNKAPHCKRLILKLSGESFAHTGERGISMDEVIHISRQVVQAATHQTKRDVVSAVVDDLFSYQNDLQRQLKRTFGYQVAKTIRRLGRKAA